MRSILITFLAVLVSLTACGEKSLEAGSPDGRIRVSLGVSGDQAFTYAVYKDEALLVNPSSILLEFRDQDDFGEGLHMEFLSMSTTDETWQPLWGKTSVIRNYYNEYIYRLSEKEGNTRYIDWIFRVFNDGVAFRYSFPEGSGFGDFRLTEESTQFNLNPSNIAWATNHEHYYSSQEHTYDERPVGDIGSDELIGCPILLEAGEAGWILLTEADLTNWAGLYFKADAETPGTMVSSLASLKRDPDIKVEGSCPTESPWRVIMVGDDPGTLIESNIMANLNDPVEYEDVSWIKPVTTVRMQDLNWE